MVCFVCMINCVRLYGDVDEDFDEEIFLVGFFGLVFKEDGVFGFQQKENVLIEIFLFFLKKMIEFVVIFVLVIMEIFVWFNVIELCLVMDVYEIGGIYN